MRLRFLSATLACLALCAPAARAEADPPPVGAVFATPDDLTPDPPPVSRAEFNSLDNRVKALEGKKTAATSPAADRWTIAAFPNAVFTKAQLTAMYPGIRFTASAAPGVASAPDPFEGCQDGECGLAGCSTTRTTRVIGAGTPGTTLTYGLVPSARAGTSTGAGCAATSGGISGCAVQARSGWYFGKNLGR